MLVMECWRRTERVTASAAIMMITNSTAIMPERGGRSSAEVKRSTNRVCDMQHECSHGQGFVCLLVCLFHGKKEHWHALDLRCPVPQVRPMW